MSSGMGAAVRLGLVAALSLLFLVSCSDNPTGVRGSGSVEATTLTISGRTQGELLSVVVSEGSRVEAGDLLATVDSRDLELQLEQAKRRLERTQAQLDLLLAGARSEDLRQAEAQLTQARNAFDLAQKSYQRVQSLYESGSATSSDLDQVETEFEQARSRVGSAEAQVEKLRSIARPEEIRAATAQVGEAEAGVERLRQRHQEASIMAPRAGTITTQAREAGEYVAPGTPLFTLADLSTVFLTIYVPEPSLGKIHLGQEATITVDGMADRSFSGTVTHIAEEAEFTPKNVQTEEARAQLVFAVEIRIDNREGVFKIGMPADATLIEE